MSLDTIILSFEFSFNNQGMVTHLAKLYQHNAKNSPCHIHSQGWNRWQQGNIRKIKQRIKVGTGKNIAYLHQG